MPDIAILERVILNPRLANECRCLHIVVYENKVDVLLDYIVYRSIQIKGGEYYLIFYFENRFPVRLLKSVSKIISSFAGNLEDGYYAFDCFSTKRERMILNV